jgi:hypothetical protein
MPEDQRIALKARILAGESLFLSATYRQTICLSFEEICQGYAPWIVLGNFMNHWYGRDPQERPLLVADPLPDQYTEHNHPWAAFCAASVRWFCATYELPCPCWVNDPRYVLLEPWYQDHPPGEWAHLRETTAEEFVQHHIFCGNVLYTNKYERDERGLPLKEHPVDLQERRAIVRKAAIRLAQQRAREQERRECWPQSLLAQ